MADLDCSRSTFSSGFIFGRKDQAPLAGRFPSRIRRRSELLLDLLFLADDGVATRMVRFAILFSSLFRHLGVVLRINATESAPNCCARQVERNACPRETSRIAFPIVMVELRPQSAPRALTRGGLGCIGMDTGMVDVRLWLEWPWYRTSPHLATHPNCRIYRHRGRDFHGRILQYHPDNGSAPDLGRNRTHAMRPHFDLTLTLVGLVAVFLIGVGAVQTRQPARQLHVGLLQANVPRVEKFDIRYKQTIFDKFSRLSKVALSSASKLDLLIWPESAMPAPVLNDQETFDFVGEIATANNVDLLLGAIEEEPHQVYNAALLFTPENEPQIYRKIHLVPFGEFVPFRHSFPLFAKIIGDQVPEDFDAGAEFTLFQLSNNRGRVAPLICFEDTVGELTRQFVVRGADLFANVTNDGWFLHSAGSRQHLANAVFRCVENRRPMVRAANTGITCFVNEFGRVTEMLRNDQGSIFEEGTLIGDVSIATEPTTTFYAQHGELFAKICTAIALTLLLIKSTHFAWQRYR